MNENHPTPIEERAFAKNAGLAPELVADLRRSRLIGGEDYTTKKNRVLLKPSGVAKLLEAVEVDPSTAGELAKKTGAPEGPVTLFVTRQCMNVRLLYAAPERGKKEGAVTVRVRDNRLHPVGTEIRAHAPAEGENVWRGLPKKKARFVL